MRLGKRKAGEYDEPREPTVIVRGGSERGLVPWDGSAGKAVAGRFHDDEGSGVPHGELVWRPPPI